MGLNQKLDDLSTSPQWRVSVRLRERRASKLRIVLPMLTICVVLIVFCFATQRFFAGFWVITAFLSWAFLFGAANATDQASGAPENVDAWRECDWHGAEYTKVSLSSARKSASASAAWKEEPVRRSKQG